MEERITDNARIWLEEDGIVHYVSTGVASTAESVARNFGIVRELTGGARVPILFDSRDWPKGDPASWNRFIEMLESVCVAAAVIANPASTRAMGAFPDLVDNLIVPFRVFADEEQALAFLRNHIED